MNLLTMEHLKKSYTERLIFDDASFSIQSGDKIGLIGVNGTGKSTLLRIAAGLEDPDEGSVARGKNLEVRFLPQNPEFQEGETVLESIVRENEGRGHVWDLESQAKSVLTRLGIDRFDAKVDALSGGQKKRAALAGVLLSTADLLILDEPTNHLDSEMAEWLEDYLKNFKGALLMVTHDRYFLDSVTNRIAELDKGKIYSYQTNYEGFLELKQERMDMEQASERKRQSILRVELQWIRRGARARSTKQKGRIQRFESLRDQKSPESERMVEMDSVFSRLGRTTIELESLCKSYGGRALIQDFSYIFLKNDRIGVVGPNGCGKTTLMRIIAGRVQPDSGRVMVGQTVKTGYFSQENEEMDKNLKVIEYVREAGEYVRTREGSVSASQMLERFLFPSSQHYLPIHKLSGGEKRRLYLLRVLMEAPNILILDEPTNDLDIQTLTVLEDYLDNFNGIVVSVSHDRYFLDRTARRILAFTGEGEIRQYEGGYTDFQICREEEPDRAGAAAPRETAGADKAKKRVNLSGKKIRFSYQEQRDWETIEEDIAGLEAQIFQLDREIEAAVSDFQRLGPLMEEKTELEAKLEQKMERWMYLNDLAEKMENQSK